MNYNLAYWENYYKKVRGQRLPSDFARFCLPYMSGTVLDICAGDCRDSDYFYKHKLSVNAFDLVERNKPYDYRVVNLLNRPGNFTFDKVDNVYCRFVLHAVPEHIENYILISCNDILNEGGKLFIETRSDAGECNNHHYRRLINKNIICSKLQNIGFEIDAIIENSGLSLDYDNPVLLRVVANKKSIISFKAMPWEEFYKKQPLNKENSKYILTSIKKILHDIPFYLSFGTLLGAYRDGDFITHDTDSDIVIDRIYRNLVMDMALQGYFKIYGLNLVRSDEHSCSFYYRDDYIDIYFVQQRGDKYYCGQSYPIDAFQINNEPSIIRFLDDEFMTFHDIEKYLITQYGNDWRETKIY